MSLHIGVVLIQGERTKDVEEILSETNYKDVETYKRTLKEHGLQDVGISVFFNGWTAILDPELVMANDEETWTTVSSRLQTRIFTMMCEGASSSYSFDQFEKGARVRGFYSLEGETVESTGSALQAEKGLNLNSAFLEDEMTTIMQKVTGIDFYQIPFGGIRD
jgi:hypothetical protein